MKVTYLLQDSPQEVGEILPFDLESNLVNEAIKIVQAASERKIQMRILGAVAFWIHCPKNRHIMKATNRVLSDLDFMAYSKQSSAVEDLLKELGYQPYTTSLVIFGGRRAIFDHPVSRIRVDVFFDKLEMCHDINFVGRLEIDYPTISLADMFLEKMQIVKLADKDVSDMYMLLREHDIGDTDKETINIKYIAKLCADDWGLWRTVTMNLEKLKRLLPDYPGLTDEEKSDIAAKIDKTLNVIEAEPKSLKWKMRARVGEKKKWYREVERGIEPTGASAST